MTTVEECILQFKVCKVYCCMYEKGFCQCCDVYGLILDNCVHVCMHMSVCVCVRVIFLKDECSHLLLYILSKCVTACQSGKWLYLCCDMQIWSDTITVGTVIMTFVIVLCTFLCASGHCNFP